MFFTLLFTGALLRVQDIRIIGEAAIVLGKSDFTITFEGKQPPVFHFAYEEVYIKEGNKWKLAMYSVKPVNP